VSLATTAAPRDLSDRAKAWVERACAEQGVPVKLSDPLALRRIADILGQARDAREKDVRNRKRWHDRGLGQCSGMTLRTSEGRVLGDRDRDGRIRFATGETLE
jgi:hypothetical protein